MNSTDNLNDEYYMKQKHREMHELPERKRRLFNKARALSLTPEEKMEGLLSFQNFMESKPSELPMRSPYFSQVMALMADASITMRRRVLVPIAAILIFTLAGGTCFAASEALPGDPLYAVKININEKVETALASGAEGQARVAASHASTRLEEAEKLAVQGRLDQNVQSYIADQFAVDAEKAEENISSLQASGNADAAEDVSSDFESSLNAHNNVIAQLAVRGGERGDVKNALINIRKSLDVHLATTTNLRMEAVAAVMATSTASSTDTRVFAKQQLEVSKQRIMDAETYILNHASSSPDTGASAVAEARLNVAKSVLDESEAKIDSGAYNEAIILIKSAKRITDDAKKTAKSVTDTNAGNAGVSGKASIHGDDGVTFWNSGDVNPVSATTTMNSSGDSPGKSNHIDQVFRHVIDKAKEEATSSSNKVQSVIQTTAPVSQPAGASSGSAASQSSSNSGTSGGITVSVPAVTVPTVTVPPPSVSVPSVSAAAAGTVKIGL